MSVELGLTNSTRDLECQLEHQEYEKALSDPVDAIELANKLK